VMDYFCSSPDDVISRMIVCRQWIWWILFSTAFVITYILQAERLSLLVACLASCLILKTEAFRSPETSGSVTSLLRR
jgi:hypothetical protein